MIPSSTGSPNNNGLKPMDGDTLILTSYCNQTKREYSLEINTHLPTSNSHTS